MRRIQKATRAVAIGLVVWVRLTAAQEPAPSGHENMADDAMAEMMSDSMAAKHLKLTPSWPAQPGDRARADSLVNRARAALEKYQDVGRAERDGYRIGAMKGKRARIYHYSNRENARAARWVFDPTAPTSLLYRPEPGGGVRLVGAMYTAPADLSLEELNQRIPLSIAQWHQHVSVCLPPDGSVPRRHGVKRQFGPRGSITTEADCAAAGGAFRKGMRAWMVHVNMFEEDVWEHRH